MPIPPPPREQRVPKPLSQKKLAKVAQANKERHEKKMAEKLRALETPKPERQKTKKDKKSTTAWRPLP